MVLILGAGFLGKSIYLKLKESGMPVRVFSRGADPSVPGIVTGDLEKISDHASLFEGVDTVIHTIHTTVPASAHNNEYFEIESNLLPFVKFLDAARKKNVKRVIYISTGGAIYGKTKGLEYLTERSQLNPLSAYGTSKLAIEKQLLLHKDHFSNGIIILRPSNIYGKGQRIDRPQGVVGHLLEAALKGKRFERWGSGESRKDYLYLEDFIDAVHRVLDQKARPNDCIFNVSSSHLYSVNDIIAKVEALTGKKIEVLPVSEKDFDVRSFALDSSLFRKTYDWGAHYDLTKGLTDILKK